MTDHPLSLSKLETTGHDKQLWVQFDNKVTVNGMDREVKSSDFIIKTRTEGRRQWTFVIEATDVGTIKDKHQIIGGTDRAKCSAEYQRANMFIKLLDSIVEVEIRNTIELGVQDI